MEQFKELDKQKLLDIIKMFATNWLAHDGCWFLSAEDKYGMDKAIELDTLSWEKFTVIEAKRIMKVMNLSRNGGLKTLEEALKYRLYAAINEQEAEWTNKGNLRFYMRKCRVQQARERKNLPDFPCKKVGLVEYSGFAKTIDSKIKTKCISCPPDEHPKDYYCAWEFIIDE